MKVCRLCNSFQSRCQQSVHRWAAGDRRLWGGRAPSCWACSAPMGAGARATCPARTRCRPLAVLHSPSGKWCTLPLPGKSNTACVVRVPGVFAAGGRGEPRGEHRLGTADPGQGPLPRHGGDGPRSAITDANAEGRRRLASAAHQRRLQQCDAAPTLTCLLSYVHALPPIRDNYTCRKLLSDSTMCCLAAAGNCMITYANYR